MRMKQVLETREMFGGWRLWSSVAGIVVLVEVVFMLVEFTIAWVVVPFGIVEVSLLGIWNWR